MRAVAALLLLAVAAVAGAFFADHPGRVEIVWRGWQIETSVGVLLAAVAVLAFAAALLAVLLAALRRGPRAFRRRRAARRRRAGETALTRGLVALAAGDAVAARRHALRARTLLGDTPVVLLLAAETATRLGDLAAARHAYTALLERSETEFLGLRGLLAQASRTGEDGVALALAERARVLRPDAQWLTESLVVLQARTGNWEGARKTLGAAAAQRALPADILRHQQGVVLYELSRVAERQGDLRRAAGLAANAQAQAPDLAPVACHNARLLLARGRRRAAAKAVERAWRAAPHPELAQLYLEIRSEAGSLARAASLQRLAARNPQAAESRLAIAEAAIAARLWGEARRHLALASAQDEGAPASRQLCLLMARLEENESADHQAARDWLDRAVSAPPDPCYVCSRCGAANAHWQPLCGGCGSFDTQTWRTPPDGRASAGLMLAGAGAALPLPPEAGAPIIEAAPAALPPPARTPPPSRLAPAPQSDN